MRLFFASSYHYPAYPAQFKHGLIMARAYARLMGDRALYQTLYVKNPDQLSGIQYTEANPTQWPLRRLRLITLWLFFYLGAFFLASPKWRGKETIVVTQESKIAFILLFWRFFFGFRLIYESHGLHSRLTDRIVCQKSDGLVFVTEKSREEAERRFGPLPSHGVFPNAVDLVPFAAASRMGKEVLRSKFGLPTGRTLVGYVGRFRALGFDKGIEPAIRALPSISNQSIEFCFVGGTPEELAQYGALAEELGVSSRVHLVGYQADDETLAGYMTAMDALMYIPPPEKFFMEETSPMKLFEYMAAQVPIIVSDFGALREILDESSAYFVEAGSPTAFARTVELVVSAGDREVRALRAYETVKEKTWEKRAERIMELL